MKYQLWQGDCFPWMQRIPRDSVDLVIADLPYGITRAAWDKIIPMPALWLALNRVKKRNAAVLLFGYGRFSAELLFSNEADYRYTIIWYKTRGTGALSVNKQPLRIHEDVLVFYRNQPIYNPQLRDGKPYIKVRGSEKETPVFGYSHMKKRFYTCVNKGTRHPDSVIKFSNVPKFFLHPTQKPVDLLEYLIKTYSNKGNMVLDPVMGSGSTGVACKNLDRDFIGIEKETEYFDTAEKRISDHQVIKLNGKVEIVPQRKFAF